MDLLVKTLGFFFVAAVIQSIVGIDGSIPLALILGSLVYCAYYAYKYYSRLHKIDYVTEMIISAMKESPVTGHYYIDANNLYVVDDEGATSALKLSKYFLNGKDTVSIGNKVCQRFHRLKPIPDIQYVWDDNINNNVLKPVGCFMDASTTDSDVVDDSYKKYKMKYNTLIVLVVILAVLLIYMFNLFM